MIHTVWTNLNTIKENTKAGDDGVYSTHKNSSEIGKLQIGLLDEPIRKMNDNTLMIKFVI